MRTVIFLIGRKLSGWDVVESVMVSSIRYHFIVFILFNNPRIMVMSVTGKSLIHKSASARNKYV